MRCPRRESVAVVGSGWHMHVGHVHPDGLYEWTVLRRGCGSPVLDGFPLVMLAIELINSLQTPSCNVELPLPSCPRSLLLSSCLSRASSEGHIDDDLFKGAHPEHQRCDAQARPRLLPRHAESGEW